MSQIAPAPGYEPVRAVSATAAALTGSEHVEVHEYEKIIQFRDTVVSGKHPRIKVPASSVAKNAFANQPPRSNAPARVARSSTGVSIGNNPANGHSMGNMLSFKANSQQPAVTVPPAGSAPFIPGVSRPLGPGRPEIDPVLLQKSDGLVKAEIQIQRQRLEKLLKDQVEERRASIRGNLQSSEQLPELDVSDILAKALTLVQATAPPATSILPSPTANASDASDSFDENTFYSSQHDTPESRPSVPPRHVLEEAQVQHTPSSALQTDSYAPSSEPPTSRPFPASTSRPSRTDLNHNIALGQVMETHNTHPPAAPTVAVQTRAMTGASKADTQNLSGSHQRAHLEKQVISSDSRDASRSDNCGNTDSEQSADQHGLQNPPQLVSNPSFGQHEEPVIRGHNLSPFAPQPAHVSPLAVARRPHIRESDTSTLQRAPAQVAALRQEHAVVVSPGSSSQGYKGSKKMTRKEKREMREMREKNNNKKRNLQIFKENEISRMKRKADARVQDVQDIQDVEDVEDAQGDIQEDVQGSPSIKPEPKSPSPLTAPPFIRPEKRPQRFARQEPEIIYDEPMSERPSSQLQRERYPPLPVHVERVAQGYEEVGDLYSPQVRPSVGPAPHRLESPLYEERRADGSIIRYVRRAPSPSGYADHYGAFNTRPMRTAPYPATNPNVREAPAYQRERGMSVRPYADRARSRSPIIVERRSSAMPPPSAPPRRIVIDEFGREYVEPVRAATVSRQSVVPPTRLGDSEVIYERAPIRATSRVPAPEIVGEDGIVYRRASPGYASRRVVTQPDYGAGFRGYRERDYPAQSMGPPSQEFVQIRGPAEHVPREYLPRAVSVRPVESLPYERLTSTRPDIPPRQYTASVHPDGREIGPHVGRDYSVRPAEREIQPAYSVRPVERYYEQPPREGDITYVERPRAVHQEVIYPRNSAPRQMYQ
ncbi:hypothetical protein F5B17DRAFT_388805 [Nemania serpens]|nr:hypothetical protein F5B17DRAFT_388805 [Nemania serpens]